LSCAKVKLQSCEGNAHEKHFSYFGTKKAEVPNSLIMKTKAKAFTSIRYKIAFTLPTDNTFCAMNAMPLNCARSTE